ncbi:probable ATP-dependent DNA helicase HFM1, partial [Stylophora pistillata]|uniref:probable ATP-dependent DNA helicase HFM1 n=1 Tax=Stylophora pistillata TaxID=50429 RepID=UPI000C039CC0
YKANPFRSVFSKFPYFNIVQSKVFDEVHLIKDDARGAAVEAVISRMKTVQSTMTHCSTGGNISSLDRVSMRLLAISATIPNVEDIAAWLGRIDSPASHYSMDDSHRPVKLRKVVLGFSKGNKFSDFRFDFSLNYKLSGIIQTYSDRKPTLVFDSSATAVILTTIANKEKYTGLLEGTQKLESSLHHHLIEHLNAEIVLNTITDVSIALGWLKSTFLYIRILKNPTHYGIPQGLEKEGLEQKLQDICLKSLNTLEKAGLVKMDDGFDLMPTEPGRLMARYYIAYDSMKQFLNIKGTESLSDIVDLVSKCREFSDVKLRMNEKRVLNTLNKDKNSETIRFPIKGRIKTTEQKVNCLIQATLGSLPIAEFSLSQDVTKIFRAGQRITRCLTELQMLKSSFMSLQNSVIFAKCMRARLWENSRFVSRQLEKVGPSLSTMMVNAGLTSLKKIEETNPREIELIVNRHPPFGSQIREAASNLPKYDVSVQQTGKHQPNRSEIVISVTMMNYIKRKDAIGSGRNSHFCILMIADTENNVVFKQRLGDFVFLKEGYWSKRVDIQRTAAQSPDLNLHLISQEYVGLDVSKRFSPQYSVGRPYIIMKNELQAYAPKLVKNNVSNLESHSSTSTSEAGTPRVPCSHRCLNKEVCGHECCKQGGNSKKRKKKSEVEQKKGPHRLPLMSTPSIDDQKETTVMDEQGNMNSFLKNFHMRTQAIPGTPAKRLKVTTCSCYLQFL